MPPRAHGRLMHTASSSLQPVFRFGPFTVDPHLGELRKHDTRIRLQEQPFQVLTMLLERPGDLVTREELRERLWPADTFVDFDHGLNAAINRLRERLGDSAEKPRYIETIPRRGYRFLAPVEVISRVEHRAPPSVQVPSPAPRARGLVRAAVVAGVLVVVVGAVWRTGGFRGRAAGAVHPIQSIAVLPLVNYSGDPSQEYFADGITEALTTDLARISALRVISRTSVMHYKDTSKTVPEIARELQVDAVVEGSVVKAGNRVRITAQLIEAPTDRHLWAGSYERELGDVLALQDEVSRTIALEIQVTLTPQEQTRLATARPVNPEAYEAYLKGRYYLSKRSAQDIQKAIEYFQQAVDKDPTYAPAYAGLADSYHLLPWYGTVSPLEALPKARAAATRALELDDTLADAHASLAYIELFSDWNWARAQAEFRRALELAPGSVPAHYFYGMHYWAPRGQSSEAISELKRALNLDPLSLVININVGQILIYARRYDEAIAQCRKTLELDSRFARGHSILGSAYEQKGMYPEAIAEFRINAEYNPTDTLALARLGHAYALSGQKAEARKILAELHKRSKEGFVSPAEMATVYLALGEKEQALTSLEKAYEVRDGWVIAVNVDPRFDSLRSEPRFQQLVRRIGLQFEDSPAAYAQYKKMGMRNSPWLGYLHAVAGKRSEALRIAANLKEMSKKEYVDPYAIAIVYAGLGDKDQAFAFLDRAYEEHSPFMNHLPVENFFDNLRSDPRFNALMRRMGLPAVDLGHKT